jgi:hypothetical protein
MDEYSDVTPTTQLLNNRYDLDIHKSGYNNIRWAVVPDAVITIDAKYEANLPGLAHDYYGDQTLWRAILAFNGLQDPLSDIVIGSIIGLPNRSSLDKFLATNNSADLMSPLTL